jgi:hypothetical protein
MGARSQTTGGLTYAPLCESLNITVNELLAGKKNSDLDYKSKAEVTIMDLFDENQKNKNYAISITSAYYDNRRRRSRIDCGSLCRSPSTHG